MNMVLTGQDKRRKVVEDVVCPNCGYVGATVTKPKYNADHGVFECSKCGFKVEVEFVFQYGNPFYVDKTHWNHRGGRNK